MYLLYNYRWAFFNSKSLYYFYLSKRTSLRVLAAKPWSGCVFSKQPRVLLSSEDLVRKIYQVIFVKTNKLFPKNLSQQNPLSPSLHWQPDLQQAGFLCCSMGKCMLKQVVCFSHLHFTYSAFSPHDSFGGHSLSVHCHLP